MDLFQFLLIVHLGAFGLAVTTTIAAPLIGSRMAAAPAEARPLFAAILGRLRLNTRIAIGVLLFTGIAMVVERYGGVDGMNAWFFVKMALVALILVVMVATAVRPNLLPARIMGWVTRLSLVGIVIAAVLAFT